MSGDDNSLDGAGSVASSNGDRAQDRSMESDSSNVSDSGVDHDVSLDKIDKLDPTDRDLYEKLKQQEKEERLEIERELKAQQEEVIKRHDELRLRDIRLHEKMLVQEQERGQDLRVNKSDREKLDKFDREREHIRAMRDSAMKDYVNIYNHPAYLAAISAAQASYPQSQTPESSNSTTPPLNDGPQHHWTFEEQFKQLYELSDDPKRKEFLDDLFQFMQKRGSPVNRIPIMAKQTLDLYELFKHVVSKGGLVEVINKKLWREITKGLNLPSSITSAAFTLRTQYMKYLYPYECEKLRLSTPQELQAAIDGNRREGRRSSYGYDLSPGPTLIPSTHPHPHLMNGMMNGKFGGPGSGMLLERRSPISSLRQFWQLQAQQQLCDEDSLPPTPTHRNLTERYAERDAIAMEAASRAMEEATRKMEEASRAAALAEEPPRKRMMTEEDRIMAHPAMPTAHLKITSRNDGRTEIDNSLVVSMEINGIMYQGVLFAHNPTRRI